MKIQAALATIIIAAAIGIAPANAAERTASLSAPVDPGALVESAGTLREARLDAPRRADRTGPLRA